MKSYTVKENNIGSAISKILQYGHKHRQRSFYFIIRILLQQHKISLLFSYIWSYLRFVSFCEYAKLFESREGGDIGLFITLYSQKFKKKRFLIRWLYNFGDFYLILIG